jgi:hypothetical protein
MRLHSFASGLHGLLFSVRKGLPRRGESYSRVARSRCKPLLYGQDGDISNSVRILAGRSTSARPLRRSGCRYQRSRRRYLASQRYGVRSRLHRSPSKTLLARCSRYLLLPRCPVWTLGFMERATGIEPMSEAWKASVLPLNHTRSLCLLYAGVCCPYSDFNPTKFLTCLHSGQSYGDSTVSGA